MAVSENGLLVDVLSVLATVALGLAAVYVLVGVALLPVWAVGAIFRVGALRRVGGGWWAVPWMALEAGEELIERITASRDGTRWQRPDTSAPESDSQEGGDWARSLGVLVLWALAIVGGLVLLVEGHDAIIEPLAGGSAGELVAVAFVVVTAAAGTAAWVLAQRYRYDSRPPAFRLSLAAAIVGSFLSWMVITDLGRAHQLVEDYCSFGSVSERQLKTCQTHLTANHVQSIHTPAARFALGGSDENCGASSGPFCEDVLKRRYVEDQEPPPGQ